MFIFEGLPAVLLGVVTLFYLPDRPHDTKWLTIEERNDLTAELDAEARAKEAKSRMSVWDVLRLRNVWLLALGIFATNTGGYGLTFWLPTTLKRLSGGSTPDALLYGGLFYACGLLSVFLAGQSADRTGDRKCHCVAGQVLTALFLVGSTISSQPFWLVMGWLCLTGFAAFSWPSPFWTLPTLTLTASAAAVSIGFINMVANLAGYLGNLNIGWLRMHGFNERACLLLLAGCYLLGGILVSLVREVRARPGDDRALKGTHAMTKCMRPSDRPSACVGLDSGQRPPKRQKKNVFIHTKNRGRAL